MKQAIKSLKIRFRFYRVACRIRGDHKLPSAQSTTSIRKSASCAFRHIGGEKRMACPHRPPLATSRLISLQFSMTCSHSLLAARSIVDPALIRCKARGLCRERQRSIYIFPSAHSEQRESCCRCLANLPHVFALDYVKNFAGLSANCRISAKSVEVKPVRERLRDFGVVTTTPAGNRCRFLWPL
jgi:hypothetical protein